jgi:predicted metalloprotease
MKWKGRRQSSNVTDARGRRVSAGGSAMGAAVLQLVARQFGAKGILVVVAVVAGMWFFGIGDPLSLISGQPSVQEVAYQPSPEEQELLGFVSVVLADTEDVWNAEFAKRGARYVEPGMDVYKDRTPTACGTGDARMGPFYCPGDSKIYIDLGFYDELAQTFEAPGDFAQAYVIAHEVGHHIQNLLGTSAEVSARRGQPDYNEWSVRLELQADFLAGVWAMHNSRYLDHGDIEEAIRAANAIGDDAIQLRSQGRVVPHAFTHGTSEQRMHWFSRGLESGRIEDGDTFSQAYEDL